MRLAAKIHLWGAALFLGFLGIRASATTYYVDINSLNPTPPYTNWSMASTDIQSAIDQSSPGDLVLVNDGVYQTGGETVNGFALTNRVVVNKAVTVQSVNGPATTVIQGNSPFGNSAVRCVYLTNNATLIGFTLTNGATLTSADVTNEESGGGIWCESANSLVVNCLVISNRASFGAGGGEYSGTSSNCAFINNNAIDGGGGVAFGILSHCILSNNFSGYGGGGAYSCTLNNCTLIRNVANGAPPRPPRTGSGGGVYGSTLNNCILNGNIAGTGGGAYSSTLTGCIIVSNSVWNSMGGAYQSSLNSCTVIGNSSPGNASSAISGGVGSCVCSNCIIFYNIATNSPSIYWNNNNSYPFVSLNLNNCCTTPLPDFGSDNLTNAPLFVNLAGGDFHLQSNSPCINAGNNSYTTTSTDLDGNPRIVGGLVDIGAYEYQSPASMVPYQWLWKYGLPITNNIDTSSPNGTGFTVYQDWIAGLNPTNPASVLAMFQLTPTNNASGIKVTWQSVSGILYSVHRSTNLSAPFSTIQSNITGQAGTTSYTDTSATNGTPYFYRVGVP